MKFTPPHIPTLVLAAITLFSSSQGLAQDEIGDALIKTKVEAYSPSDFKAAKPYLDMAVSTPMDTLARKAMKLDTQAMLSYGFAMELGRNPVSEIIPNSDRSILLSAFADAVRDRKLIGLNDKIHNQREKLLDRPEFWEILAEDLSEHQTRSYQVTTSGSDGGNARIQQTTPEYDFGHIEQPIIWAAKSCAMDARTFQKTSKLAGLDPGQFKTLTREAFLIIRGRAEAIRAESWRNGVKTCGGRVYFSQLVDFASQNLGPVSLLIDDKAYSLPPLPELETTGPTP